MRPIFVRGLTAEEQQALQSGLRSSEVFTLKRCQVLLASARGLNATDIAELVGCSTQNVRSILRAFEARGLASLRPLSKRPKSAAKVLDDAACEQLRALLHESPRQFGKPTCVCTLPLTAEVCFERGITDRLVSHETIRDTIHRLGIGWKRAKHWITSPGPAYARIKAARQADRLGGSDAAAVRRRATGQRRDDAVPALGERAVGAGPQARGCSRLGQRGEARERGGAGVDPRAQSGGEARWQGRADSRVPAAALSL
jgi:transposase